MFVTFNFLSYSIDERPGGGKAVHRDGQGPDHPAPHHGHRERGGLPDCLFRHARHPEAQLSAPGEHAGLRGHRHRGCRYHPLRDGHRGEGRQERSLYPEAPQRGLPRGGGD